METPDHPGLQAGPGQGEIGRQDWAGRLGQGGHCPSGDLRPHGPPAPPQVKEARPAGQAPGVGGVSPAGLEEVVGKSERNCREGRPGRAGPRWTLLRKQWAQPCAAPLPAGRTIGDTAGCLAAGCRRPPHRRLPRPALHHMSPCSRPPLPQAAARGLKQSGGPETSSSEEPRLAEACVFPPRAHEVEKGTERGAHRLRLLPTTGLPTSHLSGIQIPEPTLRLHVPGIPVLDSGPSASTSCSTPPGSQEGRSR